MFGKYLKKAFLARWNIVLLVCAGAVGLATGTLEWVVPAVAACEAVYLLFAASSPAFQRYVDIQEAQGTRKETPASTSTRRTLDRILYSLPRDLMRRFEDLRKECRKLRKIAQQLRRSDPRASSPLEEMQSDSLDRLLWVYLRLLYTQHALAKFFEMTDEQEIRTDIAELEQRLAELPTAPDDSTTQRLRSTLEDHLQTNRERLENLLRARENYELVKLDADRLEDKIRTLNEMAINIHEPEAIDRQVDEVAGSMIETERTMNQLQFATGLEQLTDEAPELLESRSVRMYQ